MRLSAPFSHTSLSRRPRRAADGRAGKRCDNSNVMKMPLQVAILAAGEGKRMRSVRPKALHRLAGSPLLSHVLRAVRAIEPRAVCVVYGTGGGQGAAGVAGGGLILARQQGPVGA